MAMTFTTHPATYSTGMAARLVLAISSIPQAISDRRDASKTARTLRQLSEHQLNDIGLTLGDIDRMFR